MRDEVLALIDTLGVFFAPAERSAHCHDVKDNKYLELALAAGAGTILSGDVDLLVMDPWRGVRILLPAIYLAETGAKGCWAAHALLCSRPTRDL